MLPSRLIRIIARVVLFSYVPQLLAPVVHACEESVLPMPPSGTRKLGLSALQHEIDLIERLSRARQTVKSMAPGPAPEGPLPSRAVDAASIPGRKPVEVIPTLSISLEQPKLLKGRGLGNLRKDADSRATYRLTIKQTHSLGKPSDQTETDFCWSESFCMSDSVYGDSPFERLIDHPWKQFLNLHLSREGTLSIESLLDSNKAYQPYNYDFRVGKNLRLQDLMTTGFIKIHKAREVSAKGTVYGKEGIHLAADKQISTRGWNENSPTLLLSDERISVKTPYLDNEGSKILAPIIEGVLGGRGQIGASLDNAKGVIQANDLLSLSLATGGFNEDGILNATSGKTKLSLQGFLWNKNGFVGGRNHLDVYVRHHLQNRGGRVESFGDITGNVGFWANTDGAQVLGRQVHVQGKKLVTDESSRIEATKLFDATVHSLHQETGIIAPTQRLRALNALDLAGRQSGQTIALQTNRGPIAYKPNGLRASQYLSLTRLDSPLVLSVPLKTPSTFEATGPEVINKTTVIAKDEITLNGTSKKIHFPVRNRGDLISTTKGIKVNATGFAHQRGRLQVAGNAVFPKDLHLRSHTHIGGDMHIMLTHMYDLHYFKSYLSVQGLLHLTLPKNLTRLTHPIQTPGRLELYREGSSSEPLHLLADLIAKKGVKVKSSPAPLIIGAEDEKQPLVTIHADEGAVEFEAKSLDIVKASLYGRTGMRWRVAQDEIHIGRGVTTNTPLSSIFSTSCLSPLYDQSSIKSFCLFSPWVASHMSTSFPFQNPNGTLVVADGPFTIVSPDGVHIDLAEIQVKGKNPWDIHTNKPVRNIGGKVDVQGDVRIQTPPPNRTASMPIQFNNKSLFADIVNPFLKADSVSVPATQPNKPLSFQESTSSNPNAIFQNILPTRDSSIPSVIFGSTHPLTPRPELTVGGDFKAQGLENEGGLTHISGECACPFTSKDVNATISFLSPAERYYLNLAFPSPPQVTYPGDLSTPKPIVLRGVKNPQLEGNIQCPLMVVDFSGTATVGRLGNFRRQATAPFQQLNPLIDVLRPSSLFRPVANAPTPWINQPTVPLRWDLPLPPAVGLGAEGLYLLELEDKLLLHPLQELDTLPRVFNVQLRRGYLDTDHTQARETYVQGRHQAYALYQKFAALKALEGTPVPTSKTQSTSVNPERALSLLTTTLAKEFTEEEIQQIKFMMLYYPMASDMGTVHLPTAWISRQYDNPRLRNADGGVFADVVLFKGTPGSKLHCLSNIHGEALVGVDVPETTIERQNFQYLTHHCNTITKKGFWGTSERHEYVTILNSEAQVGTGNLTTGEEGQIAMKSETLALKNGAQMSAGTGGIDWNVQKIRSGPSVDRVATSTSSSAGNISITQHYSVPTIHPAMITSHGGVRGQLEELELDATNLIAYDKDIVLEIGKDAHLLAHEETQSLGVKVSKKGKTITIEEGFQKIGVPCALIAFQGKVHLKVGGRLYGVAPQFLGKTITLDAKEHEISSLLMANKVSSTSHTSGMFSSQTATCSQETLSLLQTLFEGDEIHLRGGKATILGALIKAGVLYDHTEEGTTFGPSVIPLNSRIQVKTEQPLASSDCGTESCQEVMVPTTFLVDKVVRTLEDGHLKFQSVDWDRDKTEIIGKVVETTYQLKQWQHSWAYHEQVIPDEALIVVALGITLVTQGWGASFAAQSLGFGAVGAEMFGAGLASLASQFGTTTLRGGDPLEGLQSLTSPEYLRSFAVTVASAGLTQKIGSGLGLQLDPKKMGFLDYARKNALRFMVKAPLNSTIARESVSDSLRGGGKSFIIDTIAQYACSHIGKLYQKSMSGKPGGLNYAEHKGAHALVGGLTGFAMDPTAKGFASGAAAALSVEVIGEALIVNSSEIAGNVVHKLRTEGTPLTESNIERGIQVELQHKADIAKVLAGSIAALTGQNATIAIETATNAVENNLVIAAIPFILPQVYAILATTSLGIATVLAHQENQKDLKALDRLLQGKEEAHKMDAAPQDARWQDEGYSVEQGTPSVLSTPGHDHWIPQEGLMPWEFDTPTYSTPLPDDLPDASVLNLDKTESGRLYGTHRELGKARANDSHHIIQNAAVNDIIGYNRDDAPVVQLIGPSRSLGTEHQVATKVQREAGGGTYAAERRIGYKALRKAGITPKEARTQIKLADTYFEGLSVSKDTHTKVPGNRSAKDDK